MALVVVQQVLLVENGQIVMLKHRLLLHIHKQVKVVDKHKQVVVETKNKVALVEVILVRVNLVDLCMVVTHSQVEADKQPQEETKLLVEVAEDTMEVGDLQEIHQTLQYTDYTVVEDHLILLTHK